MSGRARSNPGGRYFGGYNFMAVGTYASKGEARSTAEQLRRRGYYARVTKNSGWGWDVWKLKK